MVMRINPDGGYSRVVEQAPLKFGIFDTKQEGTTVLQDTPIQGDRIVHKEVCGCEVCRLWFPDRPKTARLIEA